MDNEFDVNVYYSPKISMDGDEACQSFTAIGQIKTGEIYQENTGDGFVLNRLNVDDKLCINAPTRLLIEKLSFIENAKRWGYKFRFGHFEIKEADFRLIAKAMKAKI